MERAYLGAGNPSVDLLMQPTASSSSSSRMCAVGSWQIQGQAKKFLTHTNHFQPKTNEELRPSTKIMTPNQCSFYESGDIICNTASSSG
jgi:hypothetical protein